MPSPFSQYIQSKTAQSPFAKWIESKQPGWTVTEYQRPSYEWPEEAKAGMRSGQTFTKALAIGVPHAAGKASEAAESAILGLTRMGFNIPTHLSNWAKGVQEGQMGYTEPRSKELHAELMTKPYISVPKAEVGKDDSRLWAATKEAYNLLAGIPEFVASPLGIITIGPSSLGKTAANIVRRAFAADMMAAMVQQAPDLAANWETMSESEKGQAISQFLGTGAMALLLTKPDLASQKTKLSKALAEKLGESEFEMPFRPREPMVRDYPMPPEMIMRQEAERTAGGRRPIEPEQPDMPAEEVFTIRGGVPETVAEPRLTAIESIKKAGKKTKEEIRELFPGISREKAAELRDLAWPKTKAAETLADEHQAVLPKAAEAARSAEPVTPEKTAERSLMEEAKRAATEKGFKVKIEVPKTGVVRESRVIGRQARDIVRRQKGVLDALRSIKDCLG